MNEPVKLVTTKPDAEIAEDLKLELAEAAKPWLEACTKAKGLGFEVQANFALNPFRQMTIQQLNLIKVF